MLTVTVSPHTLGMLRQCPKKFAYRQIEGLEPTGPTSEYFTKGTLWATALERWYKHEPMLDIADALEKEAEAAGIDGQFAFSMKRHFLQYVAFWRSVGDFYSPIPPETGFSVLLGEGGGLTVYLEGRPDLIAQLRPGEYVVVDHKTQSVYYDIDGWSDQPMAYVYAAQQSGLLTDSFVFNMTYFGQPVKGKQQFRRLIHKYTPDELETWRADAFRSVYHALASESFALNKPIFKTRTYQCEGRYGGMCAFRKICRADVAEPSYANYLRTTDFKPDSPYRSW